MHTAIAVTDALRCPGSAKAPSAIAKKPRESTTVELRAARCLEALARLSSISASSSSAVPEMTGEAAVTSE
jgi:hypothetical protein